MDLGEGRSEEIAARDVILAPGSIPAEPPIEGRDFPGVVTSTGAMDIDAVPARLVVIGGGVIGLEFACIYEALGSQVTVLEMALVGSARRESTKRLRSGSRSMLRRRGMAIHTGTTVQRIEQAGETLRVLAAGAGGEAVFEGERVLVATGRWPNTQGMGFAEAGLRMNGRAIAVDERMATNLPNVWAIGDAVGGWMLAHKAMVEGRVAAENVTGGQRRIDYRSVPNVIFTRPEVASVGLTEAQARSQGAEVKVSQFAFSANPRARILGETDGLVRLVCEAGSGRVLGVHMMGPHVTDLIAEAALAVQMGPRPTIWRGRPTPIRHCRRPCSKRRWGSATRPFTCTLVEETIMPEYLETTVDKFIFRVATDRLYSPDGVWAYGWSRRERASARRADRLPPAARRRRGLRPRQAGRHEARGRGRVCRA